MSFSVLLSDLSLPAAHVSSLASGRILDNTPPVFASRRHRLASALRPQLRDLSQAAWSVP